jgi:hypothetical protein
VAIYGLVPEKPTSERLGLGSTCDNISFNLIHLGDFNAPGTSR